MISPADVKTLLKPIQAKFKALANPSYRESILKASGQEDRIIGVRVPEIKAIAGDYFKEYGKKLSIGDLLSIADECFKTEGREEQLFAVFIISRRVHKMDRQTWRLVDNWVDYISNWETCDHLATQFAGKLLLANIDLVTDLKKWAKQTNIWRRRFAASATIPLNHGSHSNPGATFEVLRPLIADNDDMVRKAVAWSIREAYKADNESTFKFLLGVKDEAVPYVLKHGSEKFSKAHKKELGI